MAIEVGFLFVFWFPAQHYFDGALANIVEASWLDSIRDTIVFVFMLSLFLMPSGTKTHKNNTIHTVFSFLPMLKKVLLLLKKWGYFRCYQTSYFSFIRLKVKTSLLLNIYIYIYIAVFWVLRVFCITRAGAGAGVNIMNVKRKANSHTSHWITKTSTNAPLAFPPHSLYNYWNSSISALC